MADDWKRWRTWGKVMVFFCVGYEQFVKQSDEDDES